MKVCEEEEDAIPDDLGEPNVILRVLRGESREVRVRKGEAEIGVVQDRVAEDRL